MSEDPTKAAGEGLDRENEPGQRSGRGSSSVLDQLHRDAQRNSNLRPDSMPAPTPAPPRKK